MKILVANLGSTSFKYRLFDMTDERQLARGGIERIGSPESQCFVEIGGKRRELTAQVPDHAVAVRHVPGAADRPERRLLEGRRAKWRRSASKRCMADAYQRRAAGDARCAGGDGGDERGRAGHNPPYIAAMRLLGEKLPEIPLVAAFETGFHQTIPDRNEYYAGAVRVGREVARQALGLSRREPSLHRARGRPNCWGATICGSSRATSAARIQSVRDSRRQERGDQRWA